MRVKFSVWAFFVVSFFAVAAAVTLLPACGSNGREGNSSILSD